MHWLIGWYLMPTSAVFQQYFGDACNMRARGPRGYYTMAEYLMKKKILTTKL